MGSRRKEDVQRFDTSKRVPTAQPPPEPARGLGELEAEWVRGNDDAAVAAMTDILVRHPQDTNEIFIRMNQDPTRGMGFAQRVAAAVRAATPDATSGGDASMVTEALTGAALLAWELGNYGVDATALWSNYLERSPGDALAPELFADGSSIAEQFKHAVEIEWDQEAILIQIATGWEQYGLHDLPANTWSELPLERFLGAGPIRRPIDFAQVKTVPGNLAGGVGSSDAGPDSRTVSGTVRVRPRTDERGHRTAIILESNFHYVIADALDFLPGNLGSLEERQLTSRLQHLEAMGNVYDTPFQVAFTAVPMRYEYTYQ